MNDDISAWNHVIVYYMFIVVANDFSFTADLAVLSVILSVCCGFTFSASSRLRLLRNRHLFQKYRSLHLLKSFLYMIPTPCVVKIRFCIIAVIRLIISLQTDISRTGNQPFCFKVSYKVSISHRIIPITEVSVYQ